MTERVKALGIDLGERRTGIAVSDDRGVLALLLCTLTRERKVSDRVRRIARLGEEHKVQAFVVGLPLQMDGGEGAGATAARAFAARLAERTGKPAYLRDERLTSQEAAESMRAAGADHKRIKELVDQVSAQIILQGWLDVQLRPQTT
ncbi:MAG: putative Holliday junction resolvase [Myxococcota bacterium]|jgi:putative Holliday junction resolvase